jgi:phosphoenolpyruvate carboxykinase (ATP)
LARKIRNEFFYDPFIAGSRAEHANKFYEIMRGLPHMNYFLLNTGGIGEEALYHDIKLEFTMAILDSLLRGGLEDWIDSPTGFKVPRAIRHVDNVYLHPEKIYSKIEFEEKQKELNKIRCDTVEQIGGALHPNIRNVFTRI